MINFWWISSVAFAPLVRRAWHFVIYIVIFYLLGVSIFTFHNFVSGLQFLQNRSTAELLGGDVEVDIGYRGFEPVEDRYLDENSFAQTEMISLRSMIQKDDGDAPEIRLSNLRVVDKSYPLVGEVAFGEDVENPSLQALLSQSDDTYGVLFSNELTEFFDAKPGDVVKILDHDFTFKGTIEDTPEAVGAYNVLLPSAMISKAALESLNVSSETLLLSHRRYLLLPPEASTSTFETQAMLDFHDKGWQITTRESFAATQSEYFTLATRVAGFINLVVTISLSVALYTTLRTHLLEERTTAQTLLEMGAKSSHITLIYAFRLFALLAISMFLSILTVWAFSNWSASTDGSTFGLFDVPSAHFRINALQAGILLTLIGIATGIFAYWFNFARKNYWLFLTSLALLSYLTVYSLARYQFNQELMLIVAAFAGVILLFWFFIRLLKSTLRRNVRPYSIRGISLLEYAGRHSAQENFGTLIFTNLLVITCFAAILLGIERNANRFMNEPKPSHYVADLQNDQIANFEETIAQYGAREISIYPVVRARITAINDEPPQTDHWLFQGDRFLGSDRNNEYGLAIHGDGKVDIAFDQNIAEKLGIKIGDTLSASMIGEEVELVVKELRPREFETGRLDFTLILPQKAIETMPHIFLSSLYLTAEQRPVLKRIIDRFPNAIVVSTDRALNRIQSWLDQLTHALWLLGTHILSATLIALFCVASLIMRKERYDQTVFSMIGMRKGDLRRLLIIKVLLNAFIASALSFGLVLAFVNYGFEPVLGVKLNIDMGSLALITLAAGLLCSSIPVLLMLFGASNTRRIDEFAQDNQKLVLDF